MKSEINNRLKKLREFLELTQEEFGERINIKSRAHISALEKGTRNITDRIVNDICREFGVNEEWLRFGIGEMRSNETSFIEAIVESLGNINPKDKAIILSYLKLDEKYKEAFRILFDELIKKQ
ncbi:helix-turn-helix transcriptional regulator [Tissierella sp.]|uniref:helix-turn-helix transcriptional regulator n=1 Tax=Tissierella sp. TaxID=41274 RepID=UPI0028A6CD00|nr:helix-turn-helix transcriptional regulator [Tissierella sp.]